MAYFNEDNVTEQMCIETHGDCHPVRMPLSEDMHSPMTVEQLLSECDLVRLTEEKLADCKPFSWQPPFVFPPKKYYSILLVFENL
jgi:hypothetical protein